MLERLLFEIKRVSKVFLSLGTCYCITIWAFWILLSAKYLNVQLLCESMLFVLTVKLSAQTEFTKTRFLLSGMNGPACPQCYQKGIISPLLCVQTTVGSMSNLCSNKECSYPLESFTGLANAFAPTQTNGQQFQQSLQTGQLQPPDNASMLDFIDNLPDTFETNSQMNFSTSAADFFMQNDSFPAQLNDSTFPQLPQQVPQRSCAILPRYLADSLRQGRSPSAST